MAQMAMRWISAGTRVQSTMMITCWLCMRVCVHLLISATRQERERERARLENVPSIIVGVARVLDCIPEFRLSMIEPAEKQVRERDIVRELVR